MARIIFGIASFIVALGLLVMAGYYAYVDNFPRATFDLVLSVVNFYVSDKLLDLTD